MKEVPDVLHGFGMVTEVLRWLWFLLQCLIGASRGSGLLLLCMFQIIILNRSSFEMF